MREGFGDLWRCISCALPYIQVAQSKGFVCLFLFLCFLLLLVCVAGGTGSDLFISKLDGDAGLV